MTQPRGRFSAPSVVVLLATMALAQAVPASEGPGEKAGATTVLGLRGSHFTLNGQPTFLLGISYYGALGAPKEFIRQDLDDLQRHGFNWLRVWATWGAFGHDVSAVDAQGGPREPFMAKLQWLVAECDRRGMVVDVTLTRGKRPDKSLAGGNLPDMAAHQRAVETIVQALKPRRNWYLDLANERDVRDDRYVGIAELKALRESARRLDATLLVTASFGGHDLSKGEVRDSLVEAGHDFLSVHRPRNPRSASQTEARTRELLALMRELGRGAPVHHQEPFRRGYGAWQPTAADFLADLRGARSGKAAGWCFHNGSQRGAPENQPRRSFDLRERRLFEQLDSEELKVVAGVKAIIEDDAPPSQRAKRVGAGVESENAPSGGVSVTLSDDSPPAKFAAEELRTVVQDKATDGKWRVALRLATGDAARKIRPEGFHIEKTSRDAMQRIDILAADPAGLMYGGLEVAEIIRTLGIEQVKNDRQNPYLTMRGTKFNIPLDVRTPSYTDVCDAAQVNIPEMWSFDFWREYIDTLAHYRYNYVSLWNLHPFPSLVRVPEYPDVALNDVWRSRVKWRENYPLEGRGFVSDEILRDVELVKRMTIDEKIDFWRGVMAYGKSRNVDFYFVTWNIFTYGTGGKYGITDDFRNARTTDYFRRGVCQLFCTYPDLAGIGLTTGENMPGANFQEKEDWVMATYGQGVLDALKHQPDRRVTFIHRQHQAEVTDIARTFKPLVEHPNIDFIFSFKYAKAHVYSATKQPYHHEFARELGDMKTIWTLRNDDVFYFRWGAPNFVREFVKNLPRDVSRGYYFGSDQYVWGREFLQRNADEPRRIEIDKHWYQWLLWGRFAYNPDLDDDRLKAIVAERFGLSAEEGARLFDAWRQVSMIYPITTGFHWGALDFQWYIEGCQSRPGPAENETGFHDVNRFISLKPHPESNCLSIPDYIGTPRQAASSGKRTPPDVAEQLDQHAQRSVELLESLSTTTHAELKQTLSDIRIVAHLGRYYADKIRGATELALFRKSKDKNARQRAIRHLADAAHHWRDFATLALQHHRNPLWTNRVGHVDWKRNYQYVLADIRIAGGDPVAMGLPASVDVAAEAVP